MPPSLSLRDGCQIVIALGHDGDDCAPDLLGAEQDVSQGAQVPPGGLARLLDLPGDFRGRPAAVRDPVDAVRHVKVPGRHVRVIDI